jgi:diacylglycerol kinase (ATP)
MGGRLRGIVDLGRIVRATRYSFSGFKAAIAREAAFRQELALFVVLAPIGLWCGRTAVERVLLVGSLLVVLIVELLNSAIEALVNRIGTAPHELSAIAKDMGSAAVFVALALVVIVWALILVPRVFASVASA